MALLFYNGAGTANPTLTFGGTTPLVPGVASSAQQLDLHNNRDGTGASTIQEIRVQVLSRKIDGVNTRYVESGEDVVDQRWIQVRIVQGINRVVPSSGWQPLGVGSRLSLPVALGNDEGVQLEVRVVPPPQSDVASVAIRFRAFANRSTPLGFGHPFDGIVTRLGESTGAELIYASGDAVENSGGADEFVEMPDVVWESAGVRYAMLTQLLELTATDGDAATLASGEEYLATISLGADAWTITKSPKGVALDDTERPAVPAGEVPFCYVRRPYSGIVADADITQAYTVGRFALSQVGSLSASIGPGRALVDQAWIDADGTVGSLLTVPTSATSTVWLNGDGTTSIGDQPAGRSLPIHQVTADGSAITATVDLREVLEPRPFEVTLAIDTSQAASPGLAANMVSPAVSLPGLRPLVLDVPGGIVLALDASGSGTGATTFDVEYDDGGGWASLFPDSGTDDRRPSIASAASGLVDSTALPTVVTISAGSRLRAKVIAVPGTTVGEQATITLRGCRP